MSLYLHIPATLNPETRLSAFNAAFGHPLPQVNSKGKPVQGIATKQLNDIPAANKDGVVIEVSTLYHMPPAAEKAIDGCPLYSEFGAIMAGLIEPSEDWVPAPDMRTITEALPHQTGVAIWREFPTEKAADDFISAIGKEKTAVEMKKDPQGTKTVIKGVAEEMPVAALDDGAKIAESDKVKDWTPMEGSKPPVIGGIGTITPGGGTRNP